MSICEFFIICREIPSILCISFSIPFLAFGLISVRLIFFYEMLRNYVPFFRFIFFLLSFEWFALSYDVGYSISIGYLGWSFGNFMLDSLLFYLLFVLEIFSCPSRQDGLSVGIYCTYFKIKQCELKTMKLLPFRYPGFIHMILYRFCLLLFSSIFYFICACVCVCVCIHSNFFFVHKYWICYFGNIFV